MAYLDTINKNSTNYAMNAFANLLTVSGAVGDAKTVTFPNGYVVTDGSNMTFRVLFPNGHNCADASTPLTLNGIAVVVNQYGTLVPLPIHSIDNNGTIEYKSLQANTVLEMYYTSNYDGISTPAFVIVGNPIVLSSSDYTIYADGFNTVRFSHFIDYSKRITLPEANSWVATEDCYLVLINIDANFTYLNIDNNPVTVGDNNAGQYNYICYFSGYIRKGQTISCSIVLSNTNIIKVFKLI